MCMGVLSDCAAHAYSVLRGQKRALAPLELELQYRWLGFWLVTGFVG